MLPVLELSGASDAHRKCHSKEPSHNAFRGKEISLLGSSQTGKLDDVEA